VHGILDSKAVATTNLTRESGNINWNEIDMANDSWLANLWKKVCLNEDPILLPLHAQVISLRFLIKEKLEICGHKTFLRDDIPFWASTN
jgi:hypothetical protein